MANYKSIEKEKKEREPIDLETAIELVRNLRLKEREAKPEKIKENAVRSLPFDARERIQAKLEEERKELLDEGIAEDVVNRLIARRAEKEALTFREAYEDKRFFVGENERMPKDEYAKMEIQDEMDKIFSNKPTVEDLQKIARLSFDANGLKAVNDLSASHEKGTEFLRRIAEVFHNPDGPTRKWLKEKGISKILATAGGGDEYGVMLVADRPIDSETIAEAVRRFEDEVSALDVSDLVNLEDPEVLMRLGNISEGVFRRMSKEEQLAEIAKIKSSIPDGFKFRATVSGGGATLTEGMEYVLKETVPLDKRFDPDKDSYRRALEKIMGGIWDLADKKAESAKREFKANLQDSKDPKERFYFQILGRTAEEKRLQKENIELINQRNKLKAFIESAKARQEAGVSAEEILKRLFEEYEQGDGNR